MHGYFLYVMWDTRLSYIHDSHIKYVIVRGKSALCNRYPRYVLGGLEEGPKAISY